MSGRDARLEQLQHWLRTELRLRVSRVAPASADASFRRYFRVWSDDGTTRIVMDAPPDKEPIEPYLQVTGLLERCDVHVPRVEASDARAGFVLLEDLGSSPYLTQLRAGGDPDALYGDALEALLRIQINGRDCAQELPPYDRAVLSRELALMPEWFCAQHLGLELDAADRELIDATFEFIIAESLAQPTVFVHRDFHSRNLMVLPQRNPGVIDFQDALAGPCGYDLVSLLKDCYIDWPRARVEAWVNHYRVRLIAAGGDGGGDATLFLRWFDLIGLQRHIKVLGIFARLWYRDGKSGYLGDLPRTLEYVCDTASRSGPSGSCCRGCRSPTRAHWPDEPAVRGSSRHGTRRGPRRALAAADRSHAEAAAARARQAPDRASPGGTRAQRRARGRHQSRLAG
jgi:aminoglycoside/choline kinase family phosphotransferase